MSVGPSPLEGSLLEEALRVQDVQNRILLHRHLKDRIQTAAEDDFDDFMLTMMPLLLTRIYLDIPFTGIDRARCPVRNLTAEMDGFPTPVINNETDVRTLIATLPTIPLDHRRIFVHFALNTFFHELNEFINRVENARVVGTPRTQQHIINTNASILLHFLEMMIEDMQ
jgi:hypothetical protein